MDQTSSPSDKYMDSRSRQSNDLDASFPKPAEGSQSVNEQQTLVLDTVLQEQVTSDDVPPLPLKYRSESPTIDLTQLGEFTYYKSTSNHVATTVRELPPDFLEPTVEDLRNAQASLAARTRAYQEAPLLTESLQKKKEEELKNRWPSTTIRIKFADRSLLEKSFPSTSVIKPVYAFVRSCLREVAKPHKFVLYEPPRRELKVSDPKVKDKSLLDLHLAPRSILHFRFLEEDVKLDPIMGPPPLYAELLARAIDLPLPPSLDSQSSPSGFQSPLKDSRLVDMPDKDKKIARLLKLTKGKK